MSLVKEVEKCTCPFCGGRLDIINVEDLDAPDMQGGFFVICSTCSCQIGPFNELEKAEFHARQRSL